MKILTYQSYGGLVPNAVSNYIAKSGAQPSATDPGLITFVESFRDNTPPPLNDRQLHESPNRLFWLSHREESGIRFDTYIGLSAVPGINGATIGAVVAVNEYDENTTKVVIREYDGAQRLSVLPEFEPVAGIPGLYRETSGNT